MLSNHDTSADPDQMRLQQPVFVPYDLLLKNAHLVDAASGLDATRDIAFAAGRVAAIGHELSGTSANQTIDVAGAFVSPGWIDFHVHAYPGVSPLSISVDEYALPRGVTTAVSAGDAGSATFEGFVRYVAQASRTRLFGFVNICRTGLSGYPAGELRDLALLDPYAAARTARMFEFVCLGIKVRMTRFIVGENGLEPLRRAIQAAELSDTRVMVHIYDIPGTLPDLLAMLRPGDIVTHMYMGTQNGILDDAGAVIPAARAARDRGILFDVGHGSKAGFSLGVAQAAIRQGFLPDTISTDLHTQSTAGSMVDLPNVMSKFLALGLPLNDVLERVTRRPSAIINRNPLLGTLMSGAPGDAVVFQVVPAEDDVTDDSGNRQPGTQQIRVLHTICGGQLVGGPYRHPRS
jgi:dihydroorotase